ncbi:MAG: DUF885 domain-containing protein [Gemmatimonadetes bacterium]|nr:DUF885 domain-containing protein [Gemmatimonadota bacterium]
MHASIVLLLLVPACARFPAPAREVPTGATFDSLVVRLLSGVEDEEKEPRDPLRHLTAEGTRAERTRVEARLRRLEDVDTAALTSAQRVDYLMLAAHFRRRLVDLDREEWRRTPMAYLPFDGIYSPLAGGRAPKPGDWARVLESLRNFRRAIELGMRQLEAPPPLWIDMTRRTGEELREFLERALPAKLGASPDTLRPRLQLAADSALLALRSYLDFLAELPAGAPESWAAGEEYYDRVLREYHLLPYDAEGLIALGRELHERTRRQLDSLAAVIAPGTGWRALAERLKENHPAAAEVRAAYEKESRRAKALIIRDDLFRIPPCEELMFIDTPPQLRATYAYGGYSSASAEDSVHTGRFFVTPVEPDMTLEQAQSKLRGHNYGWITVVALHEGYPGHHLQRVKSFENARGLRHRMSNTYLTEGWALYAEDFMRRAGFYETVDARLTQLRMRLWRTARVIIDPAIHTGRMSYEEAVRLLVDDVGLERADAEAEVNRYTTWPTQAPSYIVGWVEIERMKEQVQGARGAAFDEREFHERLLTAGSLPLALLRRELAQHYPELLAPQAP